MDNGEDWQKPNTFGEAALRSLEAVLGQPGTRDWRGLLLTGKPFVFAVGADIGEFGEITPERARLGGEAGHELFGRVRDLPFVTVAAINGAALGGGVEIALHCDYRTIASSVRHFACPEVFLGLIPGWGGTQLVPQLVGAEQAVTFIVENPLRQNRMLDGPQAFEAGFADALLEPVEFLDESLAFLLARIEDGAGKRGRSGPLGRGRVLPQGPLRSTARCTAQRRPPTARSTSSRGRRRGRSRRATGRRRTRSPTSSPARRRRPRSTRSASSSAERSAGRDPRGRAAQRSEGRPRRRRPHGPPARAARAPPASRCRSCSATSRRSRSTTPARGSPTSSTSLVRKGRLGGRRRHASSARSSTGDRLGRVRRL